MPRIGASVLWWAVVLGPAACQPADGDKAPSAGQPGEWGTPAYVDPPPTDAQKGSGVVLDAVVARVVDGDTIRVLTEGAEESVRLIGIDTPETGAGGVTEPECGGAEATAFLAGMVVEGDTVFLELGVEQRDRYGRLLAYVHTIDLEFVNMEIAAAGYAEPLAIEPNTEWAADIANAADLAKDRGLGLWAICAGETPGN